MEMDTGVVRREATGNATSKHDGKEAVLREIVPLYFSLTVIEEIFPSLWINLVRVLTSGQPVLTMDDENYNSPLFKQIAVRINTFFDKFFPNMVRPKLMRPTLTEESNYLDFELRLEFKDACNDEMKENYSYASSNESMHLWEKLEQVILDAATSSKLGKHSGRKFKIFLRDWGSGSIIIKVCLTKDINCNWESP